jgi:hypothetical protein
LTALALAVYAVALAAAAVLVWQRPVRALFLFVVGLALHNLVASLLWGAGIRGGPLDAILAWKEILLAVALARVAADALRARRLPFRPGAVDALALAFAALVCLYAILPQSALGGGAGAKSVLYGLRHYLVPVGAYFLGRSVAVPWRRVSWTILAVGAAVAAGGLVDQYLVPLAWWRYDSGAVGYFRHQLGFDYKVPGGLPENFVLNTSGGPLRRLTSSLLSPLGSAYLCVVGLLLAPWRRAAAPLAALAFAGLLFTVSRSAVLGLALGLAAVGISLRRPWPLAAAVAVAAVGIGFAAAFPSFGPRTHFFASDQAFLTQNARAHGGLPGGAPTTVNVGDPSLRAHWAQLKAGVRTVVHHPQGFGLGNAGSTASRFGVRIRAGESNYTELGVDAGLAGAVAFIVWSLALLARIALRRPFVAGALAAVLAIAVQSDAIGVPWLAYCLWWLAGSAATEAPDPVAGRTMAAWRSIPASTSATST